MSNTPYKNLPDHAFWRKALSISDTNNLDPITSSTITIYQDTKIVTAGSCFAQHIARYLQKNKFNYFVTEKGPAIISEEIKLKYNYGVYSSRYGNIYTTRQLNQLFDRVYGNFEPKENIWSLGENQFIDPYRPNIQPNGFHTSLELLEDRKQHFYAVKKAFENLDVFIFTLGLTESWENKEDGAIFPLCPGVCGGSFDSSQHKFLNFKVDEVVKDFSEFYEKLLSINPKAKCIISVSPVPLIATATNQHALVANTYSKSVLRAAAGELCSIYDAIEYFPSYEIITGTYNKGKYYGDDGRQVLDEGVEHVMRMFFKHYTKEEHKDHNGKVEENHDQNIILNDLSQKIAKVQCDEELIVDN